jgi:hypothetical protein
MSMSYYEVIIMKKIIKHCECASEESRIIQATEIIEVDPDTYDISNDTDDVYYEFDSWEESRRFLKRIGAD